jgi:DNA (cytosine-5)-methyltransferase 1
MNHTDIVKRRMALIKEGENIPLDQSSWSEELKRKKFASVYKRLDRNKPACTMVPGHSAFPIHYKLHRSLTVREAARIQTLPDKLKFFGSKTEQCLTVGNAVPTLMAKNIAKVIEKLLTQDKK